MSIEHDIHSLLPVNNFENPFGEILGLYKAGEKVQAWGRLCEYAEHLDGLDARGADWLAAECRRMAEVIEKEVA